jgi:rhomboid protease GluP
MLVGVNDERCFHCGRRNPGLWGYAPALRRLGQDLGFVPLVMGACGVLYMLTLAASGSNIGMSGLFNLLSPSSLASFVFGASGAAPVFGYGRWWTLLSAGWLHGSVLHIVFNMMWVRQLAPTVAELYGPGRLMILYTISGVGGFLASSVAGYLLPGIPILGGAQLTLGASASIFGLLGALVYYGRRSGSSMMRRETLSFAATLFVFGLLMPGVDNWAHAGGFGAGYLTAKRLDPLQPERISHLVTGLACLGASLLSVVLSIGHGWALLR